MALRYNPFNGSFDFTRSPGSYLDGEVATFADLPLDTAAAPLNSAWLVREASGLWLLTRKPAGIYIRSATGGTDRNADYTYASAFPDVFSDANFTLYDDADSTKNAKFQLSGLTTGTTRTLTVPDASGTLPLLESANTFTANQTLNGTNNVAPNQTAASGASLLTRDLGDARYLRVPRSFVYALNSGWSSATTTGGSLTQAAYGQRIETSDGSTAGAVTASVAGERSRIGFPTSTNFAAINFANPIRANIIVGSRIWTNADSRWAFIFGVTQSVAAGFNNMITTGSSGARGWVGIQCVSGDIKLIAVDGTSAVAESAVLDTWADGGNAKGYSVLVDNGVATLLDANNAALGTLATSVPTTEKSNYGSVVLAEASSTTTAQNGIILQHLSFNW